MNIYNGPYLKVDFEKEKNRFINSWKSSPNSVDVFKSELVEYRNSLEKINPEQIIWLQEGFTFQIDDATKYWVEINILRPRFEAGFVTVDENGFHPIAFVVGEDVLSHMKVMGVFDKPNPSVFNPKHFATEQEARNWLNDDFTVESEEKHKTEITYKGIDNEGNAVLEIKEPASGITDTLKLFKSILEENEFMKKNVNKYALLTKREKEILSLVARGDKHQEIADELFVSLHTIRTHWKNIKRKLTINNSKETLQYHRTFGEK